MRANETAVRGLTSTNSSATSLTSSLISKIGCGMCGRRKEWYHGRAYGADRLLVTTTTRLDRNPTSRCPLVDNLLVHGHPSPKISNEQRFACLGRSRKTLTWWYGSELDSAACPTAEALTRRYNLRVPTAIEEYVFRNFRDVDFT